jgi:hypothetical protein
MAPKAQKSKEAKLLAAQSASKGKGKKKVRPRAAAAAAAVCHGWRLVADTRGGQAMREGHGRSEGGMITRADGPSSGGGGGEHVWSGVCFRGWF